MASWTWSATRHWLRRWVEIVGALLFSKIAIAVIFALGVSATGVSGQAATSSLGTFLAGILLVAMAAFAPLATFSFIHWAGDQGSAATHAMQQGTSGATAGRDQLEQAQQWGADYFGGSDGDEEEPVIGGGSKDPDNDSTSTTTDPADAAATDPHGAADDESPVGTSAAPGSGAEGSSAIAVAASQASVDGSTGDQSDDPAGTRHDTARDEDR
jgi:hypothetical protein